MKWNPAPVLRDIADSGGLTMVNVLEAVGRFFTKRSWTLLLGGLAIVGLARLVFNANTEFCVALLAGVIVVYGCVDHFGDK